MEQSETRKIFGDIIDLPHHQSATRPHMPLNDRAAQFAPFAALNGFDEIIGEETRCTDPGKDLEEHEREVIDRKLSRIAQELREDKHPSASFVFFRPDALKEGGSYERISGRVKRIDDYSGIIVLFGGTEGPEKLRETFEIDIRALVAVELEENPRP